MHYCRQCETPCNCEEDKPCSHALCDLFDGLGIHKRQIPVLPKIKTGTYRLIKEGNGKIL
jgi:hypothetical protein